MIQVPQDKAGMMAIWRDTGRHLYSRLPAPKWLMWDDEKKRLFTSSATRELEFFLEHRSTAPLGGSGRGEKVIAHLIVVHRIPSRKSMAVPHVVREHSAVVVFDARDEDRKLRKSR